MELVWQIVFNVKNDYSVKHVFPKEKNNNSSYYKK